MAKWKLPGSVKIYADTFSVKEMPLREAEAEGLWGHISYTHRLIRVAVGYGRHIAARTLHHEIGHAVEAETNTSVQVIKEVLAWQQQDSGIRVSEQELVEVVREMIGRGTFEAIDTVWRDNPGVFAWIGRGIGRG